MATESKLQISSLLNGSITKLSPRRKNAQRSQDNVEQFVRKAKIGQWAVVFFLGGSWGCPVPGCLIHHLRKRKIVSCKFLLCLMARKQNWAEGERMHSEARTTWSNTFERPKLSNGQCFFFGGGGSWGCPVPGCLTHHLRKQKRVSCKFLLC